MNHFKNIVNDLYYDKTQNFWELNKEARYAIIGMWLKDNYSYDFLEMISARTTTEHFAVTLIEITQGIQIPINLYFEIMNSLEKDFGSVVAANYADVCEIINSQNKRKPSISERDLDYMDRLHDFIRGVKTC